MDNTQASRHCIETLCSAIDNINCNRVLYVIQIEHNRRGSHPVPVEEDGDGHP